MVLLKYGKVLPIEHLPIMMQMLLMYEEKVFYWFTYSAILTI